MRDLEGHGMISWSPMSHGSYRGVLQIQINKAMFHYRGAIKKGHYPEEEHHLFIKMFLDSTKTSLSSSGVIFQLKASPAISILKLFFIRLLCTCISLAWSKGEKSFCLFLSKTRDSSVPPAVKGQDTYNANS